MFNKAMNELDENDGIIKTNKRTWYHLNFNVWFSAKPVRNLKAHLKSMKQSNKHYLMKSSHDGMTIDDLAESYLRTTKPCKSYDPVKDKDRKNEARFGEEFVIYLGKNVDIKQQILLIKEFINQICYGESGLPYYATTSRNKNEVWVHLWICDREYLKDEPKTYRKSQYARADGKLCGKNDPLMSHALYQKGDVQKDAEGNVKMTTGWRQVKTRKFTESYGITWPRIKDMMLAAYYKIFKRVDVQLKFKVKDEHTEKRKEFITVNRYDPDWKKSKYQEIASLQYFIKYIIHELMTGAVDQYDPNYDVSPGYINFKEPTNATGHKLLKIFNEYEEIFETWEYQDELLHTRKLMFTGFNESMYNLKALRTRFKGQIDGIMGVKGRFDNTIAV